jgi:SRSO17 transposase
MLVSSGREDEDWSSAYRLFECGRIDKGALFAPAKDAVLKRIDSDEPLVVMMDDTLVRKRGRKVCGAAWKRDPLGPAFHTNFVWGQRYFQMSAALPDPDKSGRAVAVPIDFVHAPSAKKPSKNAPEEDWDCYRQEQKNTRLSTHAVKSLRELKSQVQNRNIICATDGGYTNKTVFRNVPEGMCLIGRIRKDARLFAAPCESGIRRGRKKYYGRVLPTPEEIRQDDTIPWQQVEAFAAGKRHTFDIKTISGVRWMGTGDKDVSIVIIRPLAYRLSKGSRLLYRNPAYLLCTDAELDLETLIQAYLWRWEIELNFRDEKTVFGVGQAQVRSPLAVETVPALVVAAYAYLLLAADGISLKASSLPRTKWYPAKPGQRCSTQQKMSLFRTQLWGIAIDTNKTGFAYATPSDTNRFNYKNSLQSTITHARK